MKEAATHNPRVAYTSSGFAKYIFPLSWNNDHTPNSATAQLVVVVQWSEHQQTRSEALGSISGGCQAFSPSMFLWLACAGLNAHLATGNPLSCSRYPIIVLCMLFLVATRS